jgi:hypothetical protein
MPPYFCPADGGFNAEAAAAFTIHRRMKAMMFVQAQWASLHSPNDSLTRGASALAARRLLQRTGRPPRRGSIRSRGDQHEFLVPIVASGSPPATTTAAAL